VDPLLLSLPRMESATMFPRLILDELMLRIKYEDPCDYLDIKYGTSTGGCVRRESICTDV